MANLSKTRTPFGFTSPRTIEKIIPEIEILINKFSGKVWNNSLQKEFFHQLFDSDFYEGSKMPKNITLAARDRITRAPKSFGFVDLKPVIKITEAGTALLSGVRTNEIFTKQLLKFQLPSLYHKIPLDRNFNVRPYLELLRLIYDLKSISKKEVAIFFLQISNYKYYNKVLKKILKFREDKSKLQFKVKISRKKFTEELFTNEIIEIYTKEIEKNDLKIRESDSTSFKKFISTKKRNHLDYADAFIRYLRATQLITFDKSNHIIIADSKKEEVEFILSNIPRKAINFSDTNDFKNYLFNLDTIKLLTDDRQYIIKKIKLLSKDCNVNVSLNELKNLLDKIQIRVIKGHIDNEKSKLKNYNAYEDILEYFSRIIKKDVPDAPVYLEWNVWRAMVMLNYAKEVKGNFSIDFDGAPLNTAMGNLPDLEVSYNNFKLIVEVTTSSGNKQYEMEGEPVARHYGKAFKNSNLPVYCLFIAPKISEGALAHFFNLNKIHTDLYGGKTKIIPMSIQMFITFLSIAKEKKFNNSDHLKSFLDNIIDKNVDVQGENSWFNEINNFIYTWL